MNDINLHNQAAAVATSGLVLIISSGVAVIIPPGTRARRILCLGCFRPLGPRPVVIITAASADIDICECQCSGALSWWFHADCVPLDERDTADLIETALTMAHPEMVTP